MIVFQTCLAQYATCWIYTIFIIDKSIKIQDLLYFVVIRFYNHGTLVIPWMESAFCGFNLPHRTIITISILCATDKFLLGGTSMWRET